MVLGSDPAVLRGNPLALLRGPYLEPGADWAGRATEQVPYPVLSLWPQQRELFSRTREAGQQEGATDMNVCLGSEKRKIGDQKRHVYSHN